MPKKKSSKTEPKTTGREKKDEKKIEQMVKDIKTKFGEGSIMKLGEAKKVDVDAIPSGSLSLDLALGVGGFPRGRVVEVFGPESSGKTTLTLHAIAEAQKQGGTAAFIDAEHALDPEYARRIGVNIDDLLISQPDTGEQALDIVETLVRSGAVDVIVIDSVAALTPRAEIEGEMGDQQIGLQARLMSKALRKITNLMSKSGTLVIFTNQIRMKIGIMFGNPETTTGGNALKFYASIRMDIRRIETLKDGANVIGNRTRIKVVKNKVAPPFKETEVTIYYGKGIDKFIDLADLGVQYGVIDKSGSWFSYKQEQLGQGKDAVVSFLKSNEEVAQDITNAIMAKVRE